jgi:toxin YhaV
MATIKGWAVFAHPLFLEQLERLVGAVEAEKARKPKEYLRGANAKLLAAIVKLVDDDIPSDPASPAYRQGNTLGNDYRHWRRAKFGGGRFRLFFRYRNDPPMIVYAWVNDSQTLRTYGSRTDAYAVFRRMLLSGNPPDNWDKLNAVCMPLESSLGTKLGQLFRGGDTR